MKEGMSKSIGKTSLRNLNGTLPTQKFTLLEDLLKQGKIEDYTYDGWILKGKDWIPFACYRKDNELSIYTI